VNKIAFNTSVGLTCAGIGLLCVSIFPEMITRILTFALGLTIFIYSMYVKSQEYELTPKTSTNEPTVRIPHKVKIITRVNSNLDKLAYALTMADT